MRSAAESLPSWSLVQQRQPPSWQGISVQRSGCCRGGHTESVSDRQRPPRKQNFNGDLKEKEGEAGKDEDKEPSTMGREHT